MTKPNKPKSLYIDLPEHVHRAAKAFAALEGRQLGDTVTDAILAHVACRFPQLGDLSSSTSSGDPKSHENFRKPKSAQARTGPGSAGYVAPTPPAYEESLSEPLPVAGADENPFQDDGTDDDLLPRKEG